MAKDTQPVELTGSKPADLITSGTIPNLAASGSSTIGPFDVSKYRRIVVSVSVDSTQASALTLAVWGHRNNGAAPYDWTAPASDVKSSTTSSGNKAALYDSNVQFPYLLAKVTNGDTGAHNYSYLIYGFYN